VKRFLRAVAAGAVISMVAWNANAAKVSVTKLDEKGRMAWISISGEILATDVAKFAETEKLLRPKVEVLAVELDSPGGNVIAAMEIGEIIRNDWVWTTVNDTPPARCLSACILIFAAGATRVAGPDSRLGIHRPFFEAKVFAGLDRNSAKAKYDGLLKSVSAYLAKMTLSDQLFNEMMKVPSSGIRLLQYEEVLALNLTGQDPGYAEWVRAKNVAKYGEELANAREKWLEQERAAIERCVGSIPGPSDDSALLNCALEFERSNPDPLTRPQNRPSNN